MHSLASFAGYIRGLLLFAVCACWGWAADFPWHFVSPTPTGSAIRQVAFLNGQFVAVGDAGTLLVSTDGASWASRTLPATYNLVAAAYANGRYVVSDERSGLYTSTDTATWTVAEQAIYYYWSSARSALLAYGNGIFLRLMSFNSGMPIEVETSSDGLTWHDTGMKFTSNYPTALTFFQGRFVAISGERIWSSTDGATWTQATAGETPVLGALAHSDVVLVAARKAAPCLRSIDGLSWDAASNAPTISQVVFLNGSFFARETATGACLRSTDAVTWTTFSSTAEPSLFNAAYGNGVYVSQTGIAPSELTRSTDGITWTSLRKDLSPFPEPGAPIVYGNGVFLSAPLLSTGSLRSTDGVHWETDTFVRSGSDTNPTRIFFCRDRFVVYQDHAFYVSTDGRTARKVFTPTDAAESFGRPLFTGEIYLIPSAEGALISTDGESWTRDTSRKNWGSYVTYGDGVFVRTTDATIETSADGNTWQLRYSISPRPYDPSFSERIGAPVFGNGYFVAGISWTNSHGYRGTYLITSKDGIEWNVAENSPTGTSGVTFANGVFVSQSLPEIAGSADPHGVTHLPSPQFNISRNGLHWQSFPIPTDTVVTSFAGNDSVFLASTAAGLLATAFPSATLPFIDDFVQSGSSTITRGVSVRLSVTASGSPPLSYQWRCNGVAIANANQPVYFATNGGAYDVVVFNGAGSVTSRTVELTMNDSWLANISSRAYAGTGEDQLIQGFVIRPPVPGREGIAILARAIGPSLAQFDVHEVMSDPYLELHRHADHAILGHNDNWFSTELSLDFQRVGAFALPKDSRDAALKDYFDSGAYSLTITGVNGGQGVVLSELYDLSIYGRLVNLSARARVGTGDRTLIAGFVIAGGKPLKVLIRGVGPALASLGIASPLPNPKLTLFDSGGHEIHNNDNWNQARNLVELRAATTATGAFPLPENSHDAAMLETLDPGIYTVHVTSMDGNSGVALVEIYEAP